MILQPKGWRLLLLKIRRTISGGVNTRLHLRKSREKTRTWLPISTPKWIWWRPVKMSSSSKSGTASFMAALRNQLKSILTRGLIGPFALKTRSNFMSVQSRTLPFTKRVVAPTKSQTTSPTCSPLLSKITQYPTGCLSMILISKMMTRVWKCWNLTLSPR